MMKMHETKMPKTSSELNRMARPNTMAGGMKGAHALANKKLPKQGRGDKPCNK